MRTLLLMRGSPACGKSTFIEKNGLKPYTLCADDIRLLFQSPTLQINGSIGISQNNDKLVWKTLFQMLEARMSRGEFTVIDATNSKTIEINRYKEMATTYRFRIICVDFTDIPIEQVKRQNAQRDELKRVPETVIDNMYSRFATQAIPSGVQIIKPNELDKIWFAPFDLSKYKVVHHIGDIHGCNTVLQKYFEDNGGLKDDEMYIFTGDYIDRGIENSDVLNFLISIMDKSNVYLLEGNHEKHLWDWSNNCPSKSKEFTLFTKKELEYNKISKKSIRMLYRKLRQCAYYKYNDKLVLVTHGGISKIPNQILTVATEQMIKGVGDYNDYETVNESFYNNTDNNTYQIHGHRNTKSLPIQMNDRCFNLEGAVEFGNNLRCLQLSNDGFKAIEIHNEIFKVVETEVTPVITENLDNISTNDIIIKMRENKFIQEKKFGNISSFNFTRDAFEKREWDDQTIKARGLYINTKTTSVCARAYEKFFNINERPETKFDLLQRKLVFPVTAYVKENGFLGIVGYDEDNDDLFITTKSNPLGEYAQWFKNIFYQNINDIESVKNYIKANNVSFVFECIDILNDPHMIKYPENKIVLLDIVKNQMEFEKYNYDDMMCIANKFNLVPKIKANTINNWQDFYDWYYEVQQEDYLFNGNEIEGFVIEDSKGFMVKTKLWYYNTWKFLRGVAHETLNKGYIQRTSSLTTPLHNHFYGWLKQKFRTDIPNDIISLRDLFYKELIN